MRRLTLSAILMLILFSPILADNIDWTLTTDSVTFSAYKNRPIPITIGEGTEVKVYNHNVKENNSDTGILGMDGEYLLQRNDFSNTYTRLSDALAVQVSTNSRKPVVVDLWFSAFRNITETITTVVDEQTQQETEVVSYSYTYISATWRHKSFSSNASKSYTVDESQYQYKLKYSMTSLAGPSVSNVTAKDSTGASMRLTFTPVALQNNQEVAMPESDDILPGITDESDRIVGTLTLQMDLGVKYDYFPANREFLSVVRVTIQGS